MRSTDFPRVSSPASLRGRLRASARLLPLATLLAAPLMLAPLAPGLLPGAAPAAAQTNSIVAVVNGDIVTANEVASRARLFALNSGMGVNTEVLNRLTPQVTRLLIDERLRMQEVQRRRVLVADEEVGEAVRDIETRNGMPPGGLAAQLRGASVEPRSLYDQIRAQIGWSRLVRVLLGGQAEVTPREVEEFIAAHKARTGEPEYLVSEIFIPVDEPGAEPDVRRFVDDVVGQLRRGVPFPAAATQFSQSQSALQGGDLGWTRPDEFDPAVARIVSQMPPGAISSPVRVPGGFQIITLRQKRETGREIATLVSLRQAFYPFASPLDPQNPTQQQRDAVDRARTLENKACPAVEAAGRGQSGDRPVDPGTLRLDTMQPPPLRNLISGLPVGRASQPIITPDGVMVIAVCSKESRNLAELTPDQARSQILRERVELSSRQLQRDLRRRASIEQRS
jgi:peptidyl-prolyl cis-trans isomerase SurA